MELNAILSNASQLPKIPKVVQELIASFNDDDVSTEDISSKIGKDQVLTAKVLRMANSSRFGGNRTIGTVDEAVIRLGFSALRTLVLASGFVSSFKAPEGFDLNQFWRDSFEIAELCKWVGRFTDVDPEMAYTCGMMHNIGELLIHMAMPEEAVEIDQVVAKGADRIAMENNQFGFDYTMAGSELARLWKFPETIQYALLGQGDPMAGEDVYPYAVIIYVAKYLYEARSSGLESDAILEGFPNSVASKMTIDLVGLQNNIEEMMSIDSAIDELLH